jgi:hypothetical protein
LRFSRQNQRIYFRQQISLNRNRLAVNLKVNLFCDCQSMKRANDKPLAQARRHAQRRDPPIV